MTSEELADKILAQYEDDHEYHFHQVDREWIIEAMIEFANKINTKEKYTFIPNKNASRTESPDSDLIINHNGRTKRKFDL